MVLVGATLVLATGRRPVPAATGPEAVRAELVELDGRQVLVFAAYVFSDTARGGPMIWSRVLEDA